MLFRTALLALLAVPAAASPHSSPPSTESQSAADRVRPAEEIPAMFRWMMSARKGGLLVVVPVVDTDPNSGTTFGVMPVWVVMAGSHTIRHIHAPSFTYNTNFGATGKYEYFYFPTEREIVQARVSLSQRLDREAVAEYTGTKSRGGPFFVNGRVESSRDSSKRFFGIGPRTLASGESNYTLDTINYRLAVGRPIGEDSPFAATLVHIFTANDVTDGGVESVPDLANKYPSIMKDVQERHHSLSLRGVLSYDTRDSDVATTRGAYADIYAGGSNRATLSEYTYYRYGGEAREFIPFGGGTGEAPRFIFASRVLFENLKGSVPFWLLPSLGGKYTLRAYGEGRFYDNGVIVFGAEQRCRLYQRTIDGVPASVWLDPFVGYGTVFPQPEEMQMKYMRPVYGAALRVVARPHIVMSTDFGVGQEGLKVFLDINYSY